MSNIQLRRRKEEPTYISIAVPDIVTYEEPISLRPNGELIVYLGIRLQDGAVLLEELDRVNLEGVRKDRGGRSSRLTLTGHRTSTNESPGVVTLGGSPTGACLEELEDTEQKLIVGSSRGDF